MSASYSQADLLLQSKRSYHHNTQTPNIDVSPFCINTTLRLLPVGYVPEALAVSKNIRPYESHMKYVQTCVSCGLSSTTADIFFLQIIIYEGVCLCFSLTFLHRPLYSSDGCLHGSVCHRRDDLQVCGSAAQSQR